MNGAWELRVMGGFRLARPGGELVTLPTRKAQGLLVILVLSPHRLARRTSLQEELWPGVAPDRQQASLRQALAHLRRALGSEAIESNRDVCRLAQGFVISCDAKDLEAQGQLIHEDLDQSRKEFMPDFQEPWFERRRQRIEATLGGPRVSPRAGRHESMPLEALLSLLTWYVDREPARALHLLRDHRDLVMGISPRELQPIAEGAIRGSSPGDPLLGWGVFFRGYCVMNSSDVGAGEVILQRAMQLAYDHDDYPLQVETGLYLAAGQIVEGRLQSANRTVTAMREVARRSNSSLLKSRANLIAGTLAMHEGQEEKAIEMIKSGGSTAESGVSTGYNHQLESLLALYLATSGKTMEAADMLVSPERYVAETGHVAIDVTTRLTRSLIALKEGELDLAIKGLEELIPRATTTHSLHIEIYAREALALAAYRQSERAEAADQLKTSGKLRKGLRMGITEWDRSRLDELVKPSK